MLNADSVSAQRGFSMYRFFDTDLRTNNRLFDNICMCGNPHTNIVETQINGKKKREETKKPTSHGRLFMAETLPLFW